MTNWSRKEKITSVVKSNYSYAACLRELDLHVSSGNYRTLKKYIKKYDLDTDHFDPYHHMRGKTPSHAMSIDEILVEDSSYQNTTRLKKRIVNADLVDYECDLCGINSWKGSDITLQLDHINGNRRDNRIENLRLLCPNCHSQTDTYAGGNKKSKNKSNKCVDCKDTIHWQSTRCRSCATNHSSSTKIDWPSCEDLAVKVKSSSFTSVADELGVSDNAIRKHLRKNSDIDPKDLV